MSSAGARGIAWIQNDPEAAFARARAEHKLVFVDLWATWCHTCLSMREFVLTDAKLPGVSARFVFLAIDGDLEKNAEFLRRFPASGWPTFYVLSPDGPRVRGRWIGAASPAQLARFFADAEREPLAGGEVAALVAAADELAAAGRPAEAAEKYGAALDRAPKDWPRAPDVRVARAEALLRANDPGACVDMALATAPGAPFAPISASDEAAATLDCAERLPASDPRRRRAVERAVATLAPLCDAGAAELTPDDRGDACGSLIDARTALGDAPGARRAAETRLAVLEDAVRGLPDDVALLYDPALSETLLSLDRGNEAVVLLEARARALPDNYNPPYHLARVALKLGRFELGLDAIERALALAYGPRRANAYAIKAELLLGAGRHDDAVAALEAELAFLAALPEGQKRPETERKAHERLAAVRAAR
ncbi:MAG TPA: thioredoxin family protein [Polyangiaceae bacterium]|nr:thioredoxin family protein [Polyangiaceae bacterium]